MLKPELLAPAGNLSKLKTALYFGADAVYAGGKNFSLRAFSDNFTAEELRTAVEYTHAQDKKIYITANIFAKNDDFAKAEEFFDFLNEIGADGVIVSDPGLMLLAAKRAPKVKLHVSTQANTLNKYTAAFWAEIGAKRIILARELSLNEIREIREYLPQSVELEAFVHGAMCVSYSGRCLLSDYFSGRSSNRGECVQACRWKYQIRESSRNGEFYDVEEDARGTYVLNSKDLNMIMHLDELAGVGVSSFKIEGRMKSEYYIATVVNAYRRAIDEFLKFGSKYKENTEFLKELTKTSHREFTTAYYLGGNENTINYDNSQSSGDKTFTALVLDYDESKKRAKIEMRNRFFNGDVLEVLSPSDAHGSSVEVKNLCDEVGNAVSDAKIVQQILYFDSDIRLNAGDVLRK